MTLETIIFVKAATATLFFIAGYMAGKDVDGLAWVAIFIFIAIAMWGIGIL